MGFSTVFATLAFVMIFLSSIVFFTVFQRSLLQSAQEGQAQDERTQDNLQSRIAVNRSSYALSPTIPWTDDLYVDFTAGNTSDGTAVLAAGSVEIASAPYTSSTFVSQPYDTGYASSFVNISWTSVEPVGTSISFKVRSANSLAALSAATFAGNDGTAGTFYTVSGTALHGSLNANRFVQYRAYLTTADSSKTPTLQQVSIDVTRPVGVTSLQLLNIGSEKLDWRETDLYLGGVRVPRNQSSRILVLHDTGGQALWDPGEALDAYAFGTLSGSASITAANGATTASASVN